MDIDTVVAEAENIRRQLIKENNFNDFIDAENEKIPKPYLLGKEIKLIIIGQDPTVRNENSRKDVTTVLNLNKENGALFNYVNEIATRLNCDIHENVYATNLLKCFFTVPPVCISLKIDHLTGNIRPPSRPGKVILASVKATY